MANRVTEFLSGVRDFYDSVRYIASYLQDDIGKRNNILSAYYEGDHIPQLKTKMGGPNDNIITNYIGVNVNRSVSRLFRGGVKFILPENAEAQEEYLEKVWELNKQEILLAQFGLYGAVMGTAYLKIITDKLVDPYSGQLYPRLDALNPDIIRIKTDPKDKEKVIRYRIEWKSLEENTNTAYREDTELQDNGYWKVIESEKVGSMDWAIINQYDWPYDFPPILHVKNLPTLSSVYGADEVSDAVNLQNRFNFVSSNTGKIIKHHATPKTIITGVNKSSIERLDDSPDAATVIPNAEAKAYNLTMDSDLSESRGFANDLQKAIASVMREVDLPSIDDKQGQLTNFGLRVLYTDALDKNDMKRRLYGDGLCELNRRLLVLAGYDGEASEPGTIQWGEALASNIVEEMTADKMALDMGAIDEETIIKKYAVKYGVEWDDVLEKIQDEKAEKQRQFEQRLAGGNGGRGVAEMDGQRQRDRSDGDEDTGRR